MEATEPAPAQPNKTPNSLRLTKEETKLILRIRQTDEGFFILWIGRNNISMARLAPELVSHN